MSDLTKARILEAAGAILKRQGPERLTVEAAADLAGVSRKTVYNHFPNRFALIDEATTQWAGRTIAALELVARDESLGFIERLNTIVERGFAELRSGGCLGAEPPAAREAGPEEGARRALRAKLRAFIEGIVSQARAAGLVREDFEPRRLTWVIVNIVEGLLFIDEPEDEPFARFDILRDSLRAVLGGVLTEDGERALRGSPIYA